jgi:hypothetical protein
MPPAWNPDQLRAIDAARELEITTARPDGTPQPWMPIWVVRAGADIYVRTWQRRETGWFGHAVRTGRARVRVPDLEADVEAGLGTRTRRVIPRSEHPPRAAASR